MTRLVYLDSSVISRMADDPVRSFKIGGEVHAAGGVLSLIRKRRLRAVTSWHAITEISKTPNAKARGVILGFVPDELEILSATLAISARARVLARTSLGADDALHAAFAESENALLLTVDDRFVRGARSCAILGVEVRNLLEWLRDDYAGGLKGKG